MTRPAWVFVALVILGLGAANVLFFVQGARSRALDAEFQARVRQIRAETP